VVLLRYGDYSRARRDKDFLAQLERAALVLPLDKSIENGMRFLRLPQTLRMHSFDLLIRMLGILEEKGQSLFIVGGNYQDIQAAAGNLRTSFPKINLVGRHTGGYFKGEAKSSWYHRHPEGDPWLPLSRYRRASQTALGHWLMKANSARKLPFYAPEAFKIVVGKTKRPDREDFAKKERGILPEVSSTLLNGGRPFPTPWLRLTASCL
jgi:hypothetical protein